jgi:2',3'-cyclic-nucleotide 2'-phosphodiesterase (5'-nucleotidase family)
LRASSLALLATVTACGAGHREAAPTRAAQATPPASSVAGVAPAPSITISVLALNDLHGRISVLPVFAGYVANVRKLRERDGGGVLLVDAGDMFQGTLESNLTEGESVITAYRALGMQAVALGNHEFDFGPVGPAQAGDPQGAIKARVAEARFPVLSANLIDESSGQRPAWPGLSGGAFVTVKGVRIGVVGGLTEQTPSIVMPAFFAGLDVGPLAPAVAKEAAELRARGAALVIAAVHAGADCQRFDDPRDRSSCSPNAEVFQMAEALPPGALDGVVAGHTHAGVAHYAGGVPVVEAYSRGKAFARLDLIVDARTHALRESVLHPPIDLCPDTSTLECSAGSYEGEPVVPDQHLAALIAPALAQAQQKRAELLGPDVKARLTRAHGVESALGNLLADLTLESVAGADAAVLNGGSLRADVQAGPLTYGALYEAMPFDNRLARVDLTARELRLVLETHLAHQNHGIVSLSGLELRVRCEQGTLRTELRRPNGKVVPPDELLTIATSDYLATGGDDFFRAARLPRDRIRADLGIALREAMAERLRKRKSIEPKALLDERRPRLAMPSQRPVHCN